jgi:hypothetical protein
VPQAARPDALPGAAWERPQASRALPAETAEVLWAVVLEAPQGGPPLDVPPVAQSEAAPGPLVAERQSAEPGSSRVVASAEPVEEPEARQRSVPAVVLVPAAEVRAGAAPAREAVMRRLGPVPERQEPAQLEPRRPQLAPAGPGSAPRKRPLHTPGSAPSHPRPALSPDPPGRSWSRMGR